MKIKINPNVCIGFGDCVKICPEVFKKVDDRADINIGLINDEFKKACLKAEIMCPVGAISITEEASIEAQ